MDTAARLSALLILLALLTFPATAGPLPALPVGDTGAIPFADPPASIAATATPPPPVPPYTGLTGITLEISDTVTLGARVTAIARVSPLTATLPITYYWQATGRADAVDPSRLGLWSAYDAAWDSVGPRTITVTASNITNTVVATRTVTLLPSEAPLVPPQLAGIFVSVAPLLAHDPWGITMIVGPPSVTLPITYTWQGVDLAPVIHAARAFTGDNSALVWSSPGPKTATFTAQNLAGTYSSTQTFRVYVRTLLPILGQQ
jgi:hypothetical protein